jgi:hypothetical protein
VVGQIAGCQGCVFAWQFWTTRKAIVHAHPTKHEEILPLSTLNCIALEDNVWTLSVSVCILVHVGVAAKPSRASILHGQRTVSVCGSPGWMIALLLAPRKQMILPRSSSWPSSIATRSATWTNTLDEGQLQF